MSHLVVIGAQGAEIDTEVQTKGAMPHARHWRQLHCEHHNAGALRGAMHPLLGPRDFGFVEDLAAARSRHPRGFGGAVTERGREREGEGEREREREPSLFGPNQQNPLRATSSGLGHSEDWWVDWPF